MSKRKRKGNPHGGSGILYIQTMNADKDYKNRAAVSG